MKLSKAREIWSRKDEQISEEELRELNKISVEIKSLRSREKKQKKKEEFLLSHEGLRFTIKTGTKKEIDFERLLPLWFATFQVNRKLYICGGYSDTHGE